MTTPVESSFALALGQVGDDASDETELKYAWALKWRGAEELEFGVQGFGEYADIGPLGDYSEHRLAARRT